MNKQMLQDLMDDVNDDIVCTDKANAVHHYRVSFIKNCNYANYCRTRKEIFTNVVMCREDSRLIAAAIKMLKPSQLFRLGMSRDQLKKIPFEVDTEYTYACRRVGDSRYLTMTAEEVNVQRALGIKDPNPIMISVRVR